MSIVIDNVSNALSGLALAQPVSPEEEMVLGSTNGAELSGPSECSESSLIVHEDSLEDIQISELDLNVANSQVSDFTQIDKENEIKLSEQNFPADQSNDSSLQIIIKDATPTWFRTKNILTDLARQCESDAVEADKCVQLPETPTTIRSEIGIGRPPCNNLTKERAVSHAGSDNANENIDPQRFFTEVLPPLRHHRSRSIVSPTLSPIQDAPGLESMKPLNPAASSFTLGSNSASETRTSEKSKFELIVTQGKNSHGDLTKSARQELLKLGLKPIPSMHGPLSLPYARCPSGIDAFLFSPEKDEDAWTFVLDNDTRRTRPLHQGVRVNPVPLPGNARYSQFGIVAPVKNKDQRISSAPAAFPAVTKSTANSSIDPRRIVSYATNYREFERSVSNSSSAQPAFGENLIPPRFSPWTHPNQPTAYKPNPTKYDQYANLNAPDNARSYMPSSVAAQPSPFGFGYFPYLPNWNQVPPSFWAMPPPNYPYPYSSDTHNAHYQHPSPHHLTPVPSAPALQPYSPAQQPVWQNNFHNEIFTAPEQSNQFVDPAIISYGQRNFSESYPPPSEDRHQEPQYIYWNSTSSEEGEFVENARDKVQFSFPVATQPTTSRQQKFGIVMDSDSDPEAGENLNFLQIPAEFARKMSMRRMSSTSTITAVPDSRRSSVVVPALAPLSPHVAERRASAAPAIQHGGPRKLSLAVEPPSVRRMSAAPQLRLAKTSAPSPTNFQPKVKILTNQENFGIKRQNEKPTKGKKLDRVVKVHGDARPVSGDDVISLLDNSFASLALDAPSPNEFLPNPARSSGARSDEIYRPPARRTYNKANSTLKKYEAAVTVTSLGEPGQCVLDDEPQPEVAEKNSARTQSRAKADKLGNSTPEDIFASRQNSWQGCRTGKGKNPARESGKPFTLRQ